jgi:hypothetical protein
VAGTAATGGQHGKSNDEPGQDGRSFQWIFPPRS